MQIVYELMRFEHPFDPSWFDPNPDQLTPHTEHLIPFTICALRTGQRMAREFVGLSVPSIACKNVHFPLISNLSFWFISFLV